MKEAPLRTLAAKRAFKRPQTLWKKPPGTKPPKNATTSPLSSPILRNSLNPNESIYVFERTFHRGNEQRHFSPSQKKMAPSRVRDSFSKMYLCEQKQRHLALPEDYRKRHRCVRLQGVFGNRPLTRATGLLTAWVALTPTF